jgi:rhamnosyltransferase
MFLNNSQLIRSKPKVAVLLAAYNGIKWIEAQINSIINQEEVLVTLFISVDLSTDGTYEYCKSVENKNKSIVLLAYGDRFGGAAKNFFRLIRDIDINNFDFIALADQDDIWMPKKVYRAVSQMQNFKYDSFSSDVIAFWSNGKERYIKKSWPQKKYDYIFESAGPGCTYVFSSNALSNFKTFLLSNWSAVNEVSLHDWLIYAYFRSKQLKWYIDNLSFVKYRQHQHNQYGVNYGFKNYIKRILLIKNSWYQKEVEKIINLLQLDISLNFWFRIKNFLQLRRRLRDSLFLLIMSVIGLY